MRTLHLERGRGTFSLMMLPLDDGTLHGMMMGHLDVAFGAS
jgi:hypothetical protein